MVENTYSVYLHTSTMGKIYIGITKQNPAKGYHWMWYKETE